MTNVEILWDQWGVPHIYAEDETSAAYACGWAHTHSHGDLILRLYAQARGNAAAIYGERLLDSDRKVLTYDIPGHTDRWYEAISDRARGMMQAFADGVNAYAEKHPETLNPASLAVLPLTDKDVLAHYIRVTYFTFIFRELNMEPYLQKWQAPEPGSNGWVLAPGATESGNAMILGNPHLPWSDVFLFYELHITTPDGWAYGATLVGFYGITLGFNEHLAWTHTVNTYHGITLYDLKLDGDGYQLDGETRPFETETKTIHVRQADGSHAVEAVTIRRSVHGPVIREGDGKALALRVAGLNQYGSIDVWPDMVQATDFDTMQAILKRMHMPMFNTLYADRAGNIMQFFAGNVPVRSEGDWDFWFDMVPGDRADLIWDEVYHPYGDMPQVVNPASGWLTNSNEPPWYMTQPYPLNSADFPPYIAPSAPRPYSVFRPQMGQRLLTNHLPLTFETMIALKFDARSELADRILDDLVAAAESAENPLAHEAASVLSGWDRRYEPASRGAALFHLWYEPYWMGTLVTDEAIFAEGWRDDAPPMTLPRGLANPDAAVARLVKAAERMTSHNLALDAAWGDVVRMRFGTVDLPARGGPGADTFRYLGILPDIAENGTMQVYHGDTFMFLLEFSDPLTVRVLTTYGNATQAHTGHVGDQLPLYARNEMRTPWLSRDEIEANVERTDTL